jgi:hypothetical protein
MSFLILARARHRHRRSEKRLGESDGSWESLKVSSNGASTIHVSGNTAYRFTPEGVVGKNKEGKELSFVALATTTYVKRGKDWLITSHHASAMPT